ncbi:unnamed protein product [Ilex paraguariensis]|uniref:Ribosomal protein L3 n=1 Tax=Ilex paraguariensis TaxID=185542 RepID=A0ABC8RS20_9AQUA
MKQRSSIAMDADDIKAFKFFKREAQLYAPGSQCVDVLKSFPKDDPAKPSRLTAFLGYKNGMSHIVREVKKPLSNSKDERTEAEEGHLMEIQVNGGDAAKKVDYANSVFKKQIPVDAIFQKDEMIDIIGVTKGNGHEGVVTCWHVTRLPRKIHRGLCKVCLYQCLASS